MVRKRGVARRSFSHRRVRRVKKYDHHVIPKRFKIYLPHMEPNWEDEAPPFVECETPTMELLVALGVASDEWQYYLGFMKRMMELYLKFTSETLAKEKESLIEEYVLRGKDKGVLEEVQEVAAGCAGVEVEMDLWTKDFYKLIQFQHIDGFGVTTVGTGNAYQAGHAIRIATGVNNGSNAEIVDAIEVPTQPSGRWLTWSKDRRVRVILNIDSITNQTGYVGMGGNVTVPEPFIGFKIVDNQIFGCVCDGVSETLTAALYTFNAGDFVLLEARYVAGKECRFYIDGVEVGIITTGLPSGESLANQVLYMIINNTAAENKELGTDFWEFYQKR